MYNLPDIKAFNEVWQEAIVRQAEKLGLTSFDLKQTCGWPLVAGERGLYQVVATPKYKAPGCRDYFYSSAVIVRNESDVFEINALQGKTAAVNSLGSCSGYLLLHVALGRTLATTINVCTTGAHVQSIHAVVSKKADFAAIDAVSLALFQRYHPAEAAQVRILTFTPEFPALPYVTPATESLENIKLLRQALINAASDPNVELKQARDALLIDGFETNDKKIGFHMYDQRAQQILSEITTDDSEQGQGPTKPIPTDVKAELKSLQVPNDTEYVMAAIKAALANRQPLADFTLEDSRSGRVVFPGDLDDAFATDPQLVRDCTVFIGERPKLVDRCTNDNEITAECWAVDKAMTGNLDPSIVWFYLSMERNPGGDYFNLVVYKNGKSAEHIRQKQDDAHQRGIRHVAPFYYNNVRIHRCLVTWNKVSFLQTIAAQYYKGNTLFRKTFKWAENK
ncbi:hypothetical protein TCAL_12056 [Tigriopus californicus]|uniref:Uncharacterized protein n=2 Tax=Tigriopus californicus TaxID=6832 RepID=A0A553NDX0_TIGCA|nr:hypothetical protein TCAL_12056 [Tigriopus californicus]|eukprot:TCALIF_12056-PA protein Name:"Protein of unknown function" AED:0.32 eAED:0.34 QI:0/-1/0/1/-1/1/1/0/450